MSVVKRCQSSTFSRLHQNTFFWHTSIFLIQKTFPMQHFVPLLPSNGHTSTETGSLRSASSLCWSCPRGTPTWWTHSPVLIFSGQVVSLILSNLALQFHQTFKCHLCLSCFRQWLRDCTKEDSSPILRQHSFKWEKIELKERARSQWQNINCSFHIIYQFPKKN